jgi:hypothetical protein
VEHLRDHRGHARRAGVVNIGHHTGGLCSAVVDLSR